MMGQDSPARILRNREGWIIAVLRSKQWSLPPDLLNDFINLTVCEGVFEGATVNLLRDLLHALNCGKLVQRSDQFKAPFLWPSLDLIQN